MAKRAAKATADTAGKVVEIVTRTTERRTGDEEIPVDTNADPGETGGDDDDLFDGLDDGSARLEIRRTSPAEFAGYVGTYGRDGWTPDRLMEEWGGGKFTIRVKNAAGQFMGVRYLTVAGKPKNKEAPPPPAPAATSAPATDAMAHVLAAIQASNAAAQKASEGQIGLLTTLVTSLINREPPKAPAAPDPLAMLEKAANILKPRGGDEAGAMTAFIKGLDMGRSLGEGGGDTSMASVFMEGIKTIKEVGAISQGNQQRPARLAAPAPGTVAAAPAAAPQAPNKAEAPVITDQMRQIQWIKQQAAFLVHQAEREKNPELYAELFLDNLPSFLPEAVVHEQMKDAGAVQKLGMIYPKVLQFPEWFEEFRAAVVALIEAPDEDDPPAPAPDAGQSGGGEFDGGNGD